MSGKFATDPTASADLKARFGLIEGHAIRESTTAMYRSASCSCGWCHKVKRRGNAWAQTSKLRMREREHLRNVASTKN